MDERVLLQALEVGRRHLGVFFLRRLFFLDFLFRFLGGFLLRERFLVGVHEAIDQLIDAHLVPPDVVGQARISAIVVGQDEIAWIMCFRPSSMRFAISISPSRVSELDRTHFAHVHAHGVVVRPNSASTVR